jgi:hypothetical protein
MLSLALLLSPAFAATALCPPTKCRLGVIEIDAHIWDPDAEADYLVLVVAYSGGVDVEIEGMAGTAITSAQAARLGYSATELRGGRAFYYGTSSVVVEARESTDTTVDLTVAATSARGATYQVWILER